MGCRGGVPRGKRTPAEQRMMKIDVFVLRRGTPTRIDAWKCVSDQRGRMVAQYEDEVITVEEAWEETAVNIHEMACEAAQEFPYAYFEADIFLLVRGRLLEHLFYDDREELKKIVNGARYHNWGGNIYLAWVGSKETDFKGLYPAAEVDLEDWVRTLLDLGLTDIIEVPEKDDKPEPGIYNVLHQSAVRSEGRLEALKEFVGDIRWRLFLLDTAFLIKPFLRKFRGEEQRRAEGKGAAVFFDREPRYGWGQLLDELPEEGHGGRVFVAVRSLKKEYNLESLLKSKFPGRELFYFNSTLEWVYSYLRLSAPWRPPFAGASGGSEGVDDGVEWVSGAEGATISSKPNDGEQALLVTCAFRFRRKAAFDGSREALAKARRHCLAASAEIGAVRRRLPFHIGVEVHHCMTAERLPEILGRRPFTAWLHLGHGERGSGLKDELTNQFISPAMLTGCFEGYHGCLQLVVFSACESTDFARAFARLGAPVAVGFENKVLTEATRQLSAALMPSAFGGGDTQAAVLEVFRAAAVELRQPVFVAEGEGGSKEEMRYSDGGARAFAARSDPS